MKSNTLEKLCFVGATVFMLLTQYFVLVKPALILYMYTICFIFILIIRVHNYWVLPKSHNFQVFQFSLANAQAYAGTFLFRNTLALHDFEKLASCFIHILPTVFSFLIRWYTSETSELWYTSFIESNAIREVMVWNVPINWIWFIGAPLLFHIVREILYFVIIYGLIKPSDEYLDSYRYLHKKKILWRLFWKHIPENWHLVSWIMCNIILCVILLFVVILAWCNYLIHFIMIITQFLTLSWNGACYYLDYYPIECSQNISPQTLPSSSSSTTLQREHPNHPMEDGEVTYQPQQDIHNKLSNGDIVSNHLTSNRNSSEVNNYGINDDIYNSVAAGLFCNYPNLDMVQNESRGEIYYSKLNTTFVVESPSIV